MRRRSLKKQEGEKILAEIKRELAETGKLTNGHENDEPVTKKPDARKSHVQEESKQLDDFCQRFFPTLEKLFGELGAGQSPASDVFNNIWLVSELFVPVLPTANSIQHGNFKMRLAAPEFTSLCWQTVQPKAGTKSAVARARTLTTDSMDSSASASSSTKMPLSDVSLNVPKAEEVVPPVDDSSVKPKEVGDDQYPDDLGQLTSDLSEVPEGSVRHVAPASGKHVSHCMFAMNQQGKCSLPLIAFPKRSDLELGYQGDLFSRQVCTETTPTGVLNNIDLFLAWLPQFAGQLRRPFVNADQPCDPLKLKLPYLTFLLSDNFKNFMAKNSSPDALSRLVRLCRANRLLVFFYPAPASRKDETFFKSAHEKLKMTWKTVVSQFAAKSKLNVNSQTGFIHVLVQTLRSMYDPAFVASLCSHHIYGLGNSVPANYGLPENYEETLEEFRELGGAYEWLKRLFSASAPCQVGSELGNAFAANLASVEQAHAARLAQVQSSAESDAEKTASKPAVAESNDENNDDEASQSHAVSQGVKVAQPKLTEEELEAICEWIDDMSKIGCLCIKYTFLRDLYAKYRVGGAGGGGGGGGGIKEGLALEKRWLDVCAKNQDKFKYALSCGHNENEHTVRWFDMDYWRVAYHKRLKQAKIAAADQVWTLEILHFPYQSSNCITRAPEKDYQQRPRNFKPRISVIFAYSASGDYLPPYFVYPSDFSQVKPRKSLRPGETAQEQASASATAEPPSAEDAPEAPLNESVETYARHGYVTSRVFEKWLTQAFLPYLSPETSQPQDQDENNVEMKDAATESEATKQHSPAAQTNKVLLYCGKLAVIDQINLNMCKQNKICLFAITDENTIPFNYLFVKSLRKRQTDLLLESWRKVTSRLNLSYQFRCKSRQQFYSVFMDAFQNCLEEIDTTSESAAPQAPDTCPTPAPAPATESPKKSSASSVIASFRAKMASTFEQCELWPINEAAYKKYKENLDEKTKQKNETKV